MANLGYRSPLGLNRWVLLWWYALVLGFSAFIIGGVDPLKRLLWLNDCGKATADNTLDQKNIIEFVVNRGFAGATAMSLVVASLSSYSRPRYTAMISMVAYIAGVILLFMGEVSTVNSAGILIMAGTFSSSFNSHVSITSLFPAESEIVFDYLGSSPDLSTLVPLGLLYAAEAVGGEKPVETVIQFYIALLLFLALCEYITLPAKQFSEMVTTKYKTKMERAPKQLSRLVKYSEKARIVKRIRAALKREDDEDCALADLTLIQQVVHPLYWVVALFFAFNMFRKYHVLSSFRYTVEQYARDGYGDWHHAEIIAEAMNFANALSFIPTTILSRSTAQAGSLTNTYVIAITGVLTTGCMCIPNVSIQWVTVILFCIWGSYIYGNLFCLMTEYFGMRHISNLQGTQMMLGGLAALTYPYVMEALDHPYIFDELTHANTEGEYPMYRMIHMAITAVGAIMCFVPIYEGSIALPHIRALRATRDSRREQRQKELQDLAAKAQAKKQQEMSRAAAQQSAPLKAAQEAKIKMQYEIELHQMLEMIREDKLPANVTQQEIATSIMQRMAVLGIDPKDLFGEEEDTSDATDLSTINEEEDDEDDRMDAPEITVTDIPTSTHRLSIRADPMTKTDHRLLSPDERRRSIISISQLGTGTAFLNEHNLAQIAGGAVAKILAEHEEAKDALANRYNIIQRDAEEEQPLIASYPVQIKSADEAKRRTSALLQGTMPEGHQDFQTPIAFGVSEISSHSSPLNMSPTYAPPNDRS